MNTERSRNLVVVRAGDESLHERWSDGDASPNWDLIVSYYDDDPKKFKNGRGQRLDQKGGKWDALYKLFQERSDLLKAYDYFWLPDDDIDCCCDDINRTFDAMTTYQLDLLQPSLTIDSYAGNFEHVQKKKFILRYTNFVEIMVPCISAAHLTRILPLFQDNMTCRGLDHVWARLFDRPYQRTAILDDVAVRHTRDAGVALRAALKEKGRSLDSEMEQLLARVKPELPRHFGRNLRTYQAVDRNGNIIRSRLSLAYNIYTSFSRADLARSPFPDRLQTQRYKYCKRMLYCRVDLEPMSIVT